MGLGTASAVRKIQIKMIKRITKGEMEMNKEVLNNGVQNNIEGMDVKMVNVNVSAVVKGLGLEVEVVLGYANRLGLEVSTTGKKINNVVSTAAVVEAIKELIAQDEVAVTNENKNEEVEGMDDKMNNNTKKVKEIIRRLKAETKVYRSTFMTAQDVTDYNEAIEMYKDDSILQKKLAEVVDKRSLLLKIMKQAEEGKVSFNMYNAVSKYKHFLSQHEFETLEISLFASVSKSAVTNYKNILAVKRWSKDIEVALLRRVVCFPGNAFVTEVSPNMLSSLLRACNLEEKVVADKKMTLEGLSTDELLLFSLDNDVLKVNGNNERENIAKKDYLTEVFYLIAGRTLRGQRFILLKENLVCLRCTQIEMI